MSVTLHTTAGDLKIEVFCEDVPKTAEVSFEPKAARAFLLATLHVG